MRILTRYVLKEVFAYSVLGLLIFTFVVFVPHIGNLLELVAQHSLGSRTTFTLFLLPLPGIAVLTIPIAVLCGTLIGLSRMSADGEVIAARASGVGLGQFVRPVLMFAFVGWAATLWMSLRVTPLANRRLNQMEASLKASQVPYEIQPRVFLEQFPNLLLYIEDITGSRLDWHGVFLADTTEHDTPKITLAASGELVNDPVTNTLTLHLSDGTTHEIDPKRPNQYSVIAFRRTELPILLDESGQASVEPTAPPTLSVHQLLEQIRKSPSGPARQAALVELHYRFALPVAALVLALVGIPIGLFSRRGGKAVGIMLTVFLVFVYYVLMAFGLSYAKQGKVDPALGLWLANAVFAVAGLFMLAQIGRVRTRLLRIQDRFQDLLRGFEGRSLVKASKTASQSQAIIQSPSRGVVRILDVYILRSWVFYFVTLLVTFCGIYVIFDFYQLLGDIVRNHIAASVVFEYYWYLLPQVVYLLLPLSILVATLVNFGLLTKTNQVTAMKSAGVSIYRLALPILVAAILASFTMFVLEDRTLPQTNQRQDELHNQIKGRPAQTSYRPDFEWIFGKSDRIFNFKYFDSDKNEFADLSVFEFDLNSFHLTRRIYAARASWSPSINNWVFEQGWVRDLSGDRVTTYTPFVARSFDELTEEPDYFKKEVKPSAQMNAVELARYIHELRRSGFDVVRLSVQLYRKLSFPLMAFVVVLIGIPFSFTTGSKGALSGIALSIGIAIAYLFASNLFEAMGNLSQLPPAVAAWSPDVLFGLGGIYLFLRART